MAIEFLPFCFLILVFHCGHRKYGQQIAFQIKWTDLLWHWNLCAMHCIAMWLVSRTESKYCSMHCHVKVVRLQVAGRFSHISLNAHMSMLVMRHVYSMQMYNLWPIFTVCIAKMRMEFEYTTTKKKKTKRQMRSTTITYFDVDMRMVLSILKIARAHLDCIFSICRCDLYLFRLCLLWISVQRIELANVTENRYVRFFKVKKAHALKCKQT